MEVGHIRFCIAFSDSGKDAGYLDAGLILDAAGNLYGMTPYGGAYGVGTVFELTPKAGGGWMEKVLHTFDGKDGYHPDVTLTFDAVGNLFGATTDGGAYNNGTVFELTPKVGGGWTHKILHSFSDRDLCYATPIIDAAGNLYGTTVQGGTYGHGTVFELTPKTGGGWTHKILHSFNDRDGAYPWTGLIFDTVGALYGTTQVGGSRGYGTVFKIAP